MPAIKSGPLTRAEIQSVWEGSVDKGYREPFLAAGEGRGFEVWTQYFAQLERASKAIDVTTQAMFISPWSGQTNPPAAGAAKATVTLSLSRTKLLDRLLVLGKGLVFVGEQTTDAGDGGGVTVATGRRYVLAADLVFQPGEQGPFDVEAEAEAPGYGYNNPLPGTIKLVSQPGTGFENTSATVTTSPQPADPSIPYSATRIVASVRPDMFVPEHVGQYLHFTSGTNDDVSLPPTIARMAAFGAPTPGVAGSSMALELHYSAALSGVSGAFQAGELLSFDSPAFASLVAFSADTGKMAFLLRNGTAPDAGATVTGTVSGATATVDSILFSTNLVAATASEGWKILDWAEDWGLTSTNAEMPSGGLAPFLDELGGERGIGRAPGESDDLYRARVREIADVVTPNAVRRALNRSFAGHDWVLREAGQAGLPGFFFDGTNEGPSTTPGRDACDAFDVDVIFLQTLTGAAGTFDFQEPVVWEDIATMALIATGWAGRVSGSNMTLVRKTGDLPASLAGTRVRGLHSGATFGGAGFAAIVYAETYSTAETRDRRVWLDYEQFRGFFDVEVEQLGTGEFGFAYDVPDANAYDAPGAFSVAFDGFPRLAAELYRQVYAAVDNVRAGGVGFELVLPDSRVPGTVGTRWNGLSFVSATPNHGDSGLVTSVTVTGTGFSFLSAIELEPYIAGVSWTPINDSTISIDFDGPGLGANPGDSVDIRLVVVTGLVELIAVAAFTFDP